MNWITNLRLLAFLVSVCGIDVNETHSVYQNRRLFNDYLDESSEFRKLYTRPGIRKPVIPETCQQLGICDMVPNYPVDLVKKLIKEALANGTHFNRDTLEIHNNAARAKDYPDNIDLCASIQRVLAPRAAQNEKNEWMFILNDFPNPVQTFRLEFCNQINAPCLGMAAFMMGYRSKCVQKYMLRKMIALNERNEIFQADFKIPNNCCCMIQQAYM